MSYYLSLFFNGLVSGGFVALMSLGMSIIFGMMRVVNFMHGSMYMLGAIIAYFLGFSFGHSIWIGMLLAPLLVGALGIILERTLIRRLYGLDLAYILILTFGLSLVIEDVVRTFYTATASAPFLVPEMLRGAVNLGFIIYPKYRLFVVVVSIVLCLGTWYALERTRLGALVRAASERPSLLKCFGGNVPWLISGTFFFACALAGLAGAMSAPMRNVSPFMGQEMVNVVFAVVVTGGMGSIAGSVVMGFASGVLSAMVTLVYPQASTVIIFVLMLVILVVRPGGIFRGVDISHFPLHYTPMTERVRKFFLSPTVSLAALVVGLLLPWFVYPILATDIILWGLFAIGFDLLFAYAGLLSFGQAAYWGTSAYVMGVLTMNGVATWLAIIGGVVSSTVLALLIGLIIARKKGIYFSMITFAIAAIVYFAVNQFAEHTGGEDGLHGIMRGTLFGLDLQNDRSFYHVCLAVVAVVVVFVIRLLKSPYGLSLLGARENERRMMSVGYNVYYLRLKAYVLSAFIISIAGALYGLNHQFATLEMVHWRASGETVMITLLGGAGSIFGPILGAGIVLTMRNALSAITDNGSLYLGLLFIIVVMFCRRGILGELMHAILDRRQGDANGEATEAAKVQGKPALAGKEE